MSNVPKPRAQPGNAQLARQQQARTNNGGRRRNSRARRGRAAGRPARVVANPAVPALAPRLAAANVHSTTGRVRDFEAVMGSLLDPGTFPPVRLPVAAGRKTFVDRLKRVEAASSAATVSSELPLAANCGLCIVRRDPRVAMIKYEIKTTGAARQYNFAFDDDSTVVGPAVGEYIQPTHLTYEGGWKAHEDKMCMWKDKEGVLRFWLENNVTNSDAAFTIAGLPASTAVSIKLDVLFGGKRTIITLTDTTDAGGVGVFVIPAAAIGFAVLQGDDDLSAQTIAIAYNNASQFAFRQLAVPQFYTNMPDVDALRVNSVSLLYSDRTAELYSQGSIVAYQCAGGEDWGVHLGINGPALTADLDTYSKVASYNDSFKGQYKLGRYLPLKLSANPADLAMTSMGDGEGAQKVPPPIDMLNEPDYIYMAYNAGTSAVTPAGEWTAHFHVEGETESQWRNTANPTLHPAVMLDAQWASGMVECDFHNPDHGWKVFKNILRAGSGIAGELANHMPTYGPVLRGISRVGRALLG